MAQNFTVFLTFVLKTLWANSWRNCSFIHHQFILRKRCYKGCTGDPDTVNTGYWSGLSVWPNTGYWMSGLSVWSDTGYAAFFKTKLFLTFHSFFFLNKFYFLHNKQQHISLFPTCEDFWPPYTCSWKSYTNEGTKPNFFPNDTIQKSIMFYLGVCVYRVRLGWSGGGPTSWLTTPGSSWTAVDDSTLTRSVRIAARVFLFTNPIWATELFVQKFVIQFLEYCQS